MLPCTATSPSLQCMSPKMADNKLDWVAAVKDQEDSYIPFVVLNCTFPAPTRPKIPKSSPFFTERLIPSRVASDPSFDHEKSASLIDNTWRRWLELVNSQQETKRLTSSPNCNIGVSTTFLYIWSSSELRKDESLFIETTASIILDVTKLTCRKSSEKENKMPVDKYRTISRGNCKSIKSDIAGKIKSEVRGLDDTTATVAKELNATTKGIPLQNAMWQDWKMQVKVQVYKKKI